MFKTIIDAYNKYILLEDRIAQLEKRICELESKSIHVKSPACCAKCDKGIYRPTGEPRYLLGVKVGEVWRCDKCGHVPDELKMQELSQL